jgi:hypothetical protein
MSVVMSMHWAEATPEQYDQVRERVRWEEQTPDGAVLHVAWFDPEGLHVTDVWNEPGDFESFMADRLGPVIQEVGIEGKPQVTFIPLHRRFVAPGVGGAGD